MVAAQIRQKARESLTSKWGKAALITLVYSIITFIISFVLNIVPMIGYLVAIAVSLPLTYGLVVTFMKLKQGEEVTYTEFFANGFNSFGKVWLVYFNKLIKLIIPIICVIGSYIVLFLGTILLTSGEMLSSNSNIVTGGLLALVGAIALIVSNAYAIVKSYLYKLSMYVQKDNPEMSAKEIVEESERLMKGHRWEFFWLELTFIGWAILATISFGIGYLWLIPYMEISRIEFYEQLSGTKANSEAEEA